MTPNQSRSLINSGHLTPAQAHALSGSVQKAKPWRSPFALTALALIVGIVIGVIASQALHLAQDVRWRMVYQEGTR